MARQARLISETGYYHVYTRGNGRQIIFPQRDDFIYYLKKLKYFSSETNTVICAFCLMENHIHLIIFDKEKNMSLMMQQLNTTYAVYFNNKYNHSGHLFAGRFCSIPIESEDYLLTVFRYILNNPRKAGICPASKYPYSSYSRYGESESFVDTSVFVNMLGSKAEYEAYIAAKYEDCPELEEILPGDAWANSVMRQWLHTKNGKDLQNLDEISRKAAILLLLKKGLTGRQIEKLTGISAAEILSVYNQEGKEG